MGLIDAMKLVGMVANVVLAVWVLSTCWRVIRFLDWVMKTNRAVHYRWKNGAEFVLNEPCLKHGQQASDDRQA